MKLSIKHFANKFGMSSFIYGVCDSQLQQALRFGCFAEMKKDACIEVAKSVC